MKTKLDPQDSKALSDALETIFKIGQKYGLDKKNPKFYAHMKKTFEILKEVK